MSRTCYGTRGLAREIGRLRRLGKSDEVIAVRLSIPVSRILEIEQRHGEKKTENPTMPPGEKAKSD